MLAKTWNSNLESRAYDAAYYDNHTKYYNRGIKNFEKFVRDNISFHSLCELGCGTGAFSAPFLQDKDVLGVDFSVGASEVTLLGKNFMNGDLSKPLGLNKTFDVVLSLEVWEHLMPEVEQEYLDNLFVLQPKTLILSCAIPGQVGRHHYLPHTHAEANAIVAQRGYAPNEQLTEKFRNIKSLAKFYRVNTFVYELMHEPSIPWCLNCKKRTKQYKTYCSKECHDTVATQNTTRAPFKNKDGSNKTEGQYMLSRRSVL